MNALTKLLYSCIWYIGRFWSCIYSYTCISDLNKLNTKLYSAWISKEFKSFGKNSVVQQHIHLLGGKYISIGNKTCIGTRTALTAWDKYGADTFQPEIIIGNNVSIGDDSHITAINRIEIGNNVLTGKKITISDNSHGKSELELLSFPPAVRPYTALHLLLLKMAFG